MKKTTLSSSVEQEKLNATRFYAEKKDATIEAELEDFLSKLYEKYVPAATREYIDETADDIKPPSKPTKPQVAEQPRESTI